MLEHNCRSKKRRGRGSSYGMHDSDSLFKKLDIKNGENFLDLGCGIGEYSLHSSRHVGKEGRVYSLDLRQEALYQLSERIIDEKINNIDVRTCDMTAALPLENSTIDTCLIATVLHIYKLEDVKEKIFNEIHRVLKIGGSLAIVECKKEEFSFGPPKHRRHSYEDLKKAIEPFGFKEKSYLDLGCNYMVKFESV